MSTPTTIYATNERERTSPVFRPSAHSKDVRPAKTSGFDLDLSLIEPPFPIETKEKLHRRLMEAREDSSDLAKLIGRGHADIERFLANHPLSPSSLLRVIYMQSNDPVARRQAISHQNADEHIRISAQNSRVDADRAALARGWSGSDPRVVAALENDRAAIVRNAVAAHRDLQDEHEATKAVLKERREEVLIGFAANPYMHPKALTILSTNASPNVRAMVAQHPGTSDDAIIALMGDQNPEVAAAALEEFDARRSR